MKSVIHVQPFYCHYRSTCIRGTVAQWVEHWTCNQQIVGSNHIRVKSCTTTLVSCSHLCASATKQYNMVPAKGRWCSTAGKVIAGLAESNGSLPPGGLQSPAGWLPVHWDQLQVQCSMMSMVSLYLFRSTCVDLHPLFCWNKVVLPACHWWQPMQLD